MTEEEPSGQELPIEVCDNKKRLSTSLATKSSPPHQAKTYSPTLEDKRAYVWHIQSPRALQLCKSCFRRQRHLRSKGIPVFHERAQFSRKNGGMKHIEAALEISGLFVGASCSRRGQRSAENSSLERKTFLRLQWFLMELLWY